MDPQFERLTNNLTTDMKRLKVPGAAIGIYHEGRESVAGFGRTSVENPLSVRADTLFQVGSISKTFTGTALMRLVEGGELSLDTPVRKVLPKFKMSDAEVTRKLTLRHLLTHTGGWIGDYFDDFGNGDDALQKMVKKIRKLPQVTPLGQVWSYNNAGFNIASRILEVVTGKPYETALQDMILTPLGLEMTFFYPNDVLFTHRFAVGHQKFGNKLKVARPWAIGRAGNGVGGVVSTVPDLLKYARFHMGDGTNERGTRLIKRKTLVSMREPQADAGGRGKIGLTWFIRQVGDLTIYSHGGATNGQQALLFFIPQQDFAAALLTNSDDGGIITAALLNWVLQCYFETSIPAPVTLEKTLPELEAYAGRYELPISCFDLNVSGGHLVYQEIPRGGFPTPDSPPGPPAPPVHFAFYDHDRVVGLDEPFKGSLCEFLRAGDGKVAYMRIGGRVHPKVS